MKRLLELVKKLFEQKKYNAKDIRDLSDSGYLRYINTRYNHKIVIVEDDIVDTAKEGGKGVVTTFDDEIIRTKQKEFVNYFEQKGYTVKEFDTVVLILW